MDFHKRFLQLMNDHDVTAYRISKDTGIGERLVGYWKDGEKTPNLENLIRISDYFSVSIDYLVGRSDNPKLK